MRRAEVMTPAKLDDVQLIRTIKVQYPWGRVRLGPKFRYGFSLREAHGTSWILLFSDEKGTLDLILRGP